MENTLKDPIAQKIIDFIAEIGLEVSVNSLDTDTFLPGIRVDKGGLLIDETQLQYPGDLLHEAGHLALATSEIRAGLSGEVVLPGVLMEAVESAAMAWSYAAILHLGLSPEIVFHAGGYGGRSEQLLLNFTLGIYIGANLLEEAGLTAFGARARDLGVEPFPYMIKWVRD